MFCQSCQSDISLKLCSRCHRVKYCSKQCQISDWPNHKSNCEPLSTHKCPSEQVFDNQTDIKSKMDNLSIDSMNAHNVVNQSNVVNVSEEVMDSNEEFTPTLTPISSLKSLPLVANYYNNYNNINANKKLIDKKCKVIEKMQLYCETILDDMNNFGFCVIDDFLDDIGDDILTEAKFLYNRKVFKAGQLVNNKATNSRVIRGDRITWVEGTEPICTHIGFLMQTLDSIVMHCNTMANNGQFCRYRINRRTKAMVACYPGHNSGYVRHIDNPNRDGRCVTSIYYLNKDYDRQRDGGVLRLYPEMNSGHVADIDPKFNRVIFFWSDRRNPHAVMPSKSMRFAITVWYFDAEEREKYSATQLLKQNEPCQSDKDLRPFY